MSREKKIDLGFWARQFGGVIGASNDDVDFITSRLRECVDRVRGVPPETPPAEEPPTTDDGKVPCPRCGKEQNRITPARKAKYGWCYECERNDAIEVQFRDTLAMKLAVERARDLNLALDAPFSVEALAKWVWEIAFAVAKARPR
jgi:endogenous inhibitor of DNA gyrase (YacG/DUF329 family)